MITNPYKEKYYNINQNNAYQMKIFSFYNVYYFYLENNDSYL